MHKEAGKIQFNFSPQLDVVFLAGLYDTDYEQAELVFETSSEQIRIELQHAREKFSAGDAAALKKVVHKMKPLFGYVGLNKIISDFAAFEEVCAGAEYISQTENGFNHIVAITEEALQTIDSEATRLKQFNTQCL